MKYCRLVRDFLKVYQYIIMSAFVWNILSIVGTLLLIQTEIVYFSFFVGFRYFLQFIFLFQSSNTISPATLLTYSLQLFWGYAVIFIFCELGERLTQEYDKLYDVICEFNWYAYPLKVQRILPIAFAGAQDQIILQGFGNCLCTREAFKNVG